MTTSRPLKHSLESLVEAIRGEDEDTYINSLPAFKAGSNNAG